MPTSTVARIRFRKPLRSLGPGHDPSPRRGGRATTEIDLKASPEFLTFGRWFILDIGRGAPTLDEMYDFVLNLFRGEERVRLRQFIDRTLEGSDATLERLWKETDADIYFFTTQDLRTFLAGARDRI